MKQAFYDLCRAAELAAKEVGLARARLEPTAAAIYTETVWYTALSCGEALGLMKNPEILPPCFRYGGGSRGPHGARSSLDYRWSKWKERPESYLPFAWPRLYPGSL